MKIAADVYNIGVSDCTIDLFEGIYQVPDGMLYNSYVIMDEKITVFDTVDENFGKDWMENLEKVLEEKEPTYLIVQHMEPDHSANIHFFMERYKNAKVVASEKAFVMMGQYFGENYSERRIVVGDGDTLDIGTRSLQFISAVMIHWPEVIVTYDPKEKMLFSADGFGKFGTSVSEDNWVDEGRRYYIGIVGKYGNSVQSFLEKIVKLDVEIICPLHGPVLKEMPGKYLYLYDVWSRYEPEEKGVLIAYTSVYGNTKHAVMELLDELKKKGIENVVVRDLSRCDQAEAVADAFRYSHLILATTTYNLEIFPAMRQFLDYLIERNFRNRTVGFVENGSWMPVATKLMQEKLSKCKNLVFAEQTVRILSAMNEENKKQIKGLVKELFREEEN